jgi:hypothetical protein
MPSNFIDWRTSVSELSILQNTLHNRFKSLSMGFKLIVVCGLALLMTIPALFVFSLVNEGTVPTM